MSSTTLKVCATSHCFCFHHRCSLSPTVINDAAWAWPALYCARSCRTFRYNQPQPATSATRPAVYFGFPPLPGPYCRRRRLQCQPVTSASPRIVSSTSSWLVLHSAIYRIVAQPSPFCAVVLPYCHCRRQRYPDLTLNCSDAPDHPHVSPLPASALSLSLSPVIVIHAVLCLR